MFPYSALFGTTVDTCCVKYGLCLATETGTHSANCARTSPLRSPRCSSRTSLTCPLFSETVAWGWTVPKTVEVPQLPLVQFLAVIDMPVVFVTTGACVGPDSAENV